MITERRCEPESERPHKSGGNQDRKSPPVKENPVRIVTYIPTSSPFDPPTCTEGNSTNDNFLGLCSYACNFGFCPRNSCSCSSEGPLIQPPAQTSTDIGISLVGPDSDLCNFACTRGYCPSSTCTTSANFDVSVLASLGDSFASGPSAGDEYDDTPCRRFTQAAGPQLSLSDEINGPKPIDFKFIACSGARAKQIYQDSGASSSSCGGNGKPKRSQANQLADLNLNFDMITLSIGGNDADFVSVMDGCVYRFTDAKGCAGCTPSLTHNDCSDDCSNALDDMNGRLEDTSLISGLTSSIEAIFKAAPRAHLFMIQPSNSFLIGVPPLDEHISVLLFSKGAATGDNSLYPPAPVNLVTCQVLAHKES
ncbi:hypothetical protein N7490_008828 [Penicillium lividum]|nr:hypothetical protein N7490_008828 [Penicillium lividum]